MSGELDRLTFLDLEVDVVERELERMAGERRSGPSAENVLHDLAARTEDPVSRLVP